MLANDFVGKRVFSIYNLHWIYQKSEEELKNSQEL